MNGIVSMILGIFLFTASIGYAVSSTATRHAISYLTNLDFIVEGSVFVKSADASFVPPVDYKQTFALKVSSLQWQMTLTSLVETSPFIKLDVGYDGSAIFYVAHSRSDSGENQNVGIVEHGFIPHDCFGFPASYVWLAFVSGVCLPANTNSSSLQPIHDVSYLGDLAKSFLCKTVWARNLSSPAFLNKIQFYENGVFAGFENAVPIFKKAAPPFEKEYVRLESIVIGETNIDGLVIPSLIEISEFAPPILSDHQAFKELFMFRKTTVSVSRVGGHGFDGDFRPVSNIAINIADRRSGREFSYVLPKGGWLETNSVQYRKLVENEHVFKNARENNVKTRRPQALTVSFIMLGTTLLIGWLIFRRQMIKPKNC